MKIIGLNGSPRRYGNTAKMLEVALETAKTLGASVERIDLYQYKIEPCVGCLSDDELVCKLPCKIRDDMETIYNKIQEADGIIFATPVYWFNMSGVMKNFIDRITVFENMIHHVGRSLVEGKVAGIIAAGNEEGGAMVVANLMITLNSMGFLIPPWGFAYYTKIGDALEDKNALYDSANVGVVIVKAIKRLSGEEWYTTDLPIDEIVNRVRNRISKMFEKDYPWRKEKYLYED
ncbi:MAG: flavodoxin family protein [Thermoprotei archaeon]|nr:MAG: flavodoxin family protein [Thermoprotei archaeon]